jgi:hypothetical protein
MALRTQQNANQDELNSWVLGSKNCAAGWDNATDEREKSAVSEPVRERQSCEPERSAPSRGRRRQSVEPGSWGLDAVTP